MPQTSNIPSIDSATCIFDMNAVNEAIDQVASSINQYFCEQASEPFELLVMPLMNGGLVFSGVLLPKLAMNITLDYFHVTRYRDTNTGGDDIEWRVLPKQNVAGKHVLLLDDIYDHGITLDVVVNWCKDQNVASVSSAVLASKNIANPEIREHLVSPTFSAMTLPDAYVFGAGMDFKGYHRNAPGIFTFDEC